jgi:NAD-dependent deacetylase
MSSENTPKFPQLLLENLREAEHVAILTGAGISAESGLPTFRDPLTGLWAKYRPEDLINREAFQRDPKLVWDWFAWLKGLIDQAAPNPAHLALAALEELVPKVTLITQNIDGLHQQAGSTNVIELHGNLYHTKCFNEDRPITEWEKTDEVPPRCPRCGGLLRPDVVWFGEMLPKPALQAAAQAAQLCDVFFSIGTSGTVAPAAAIPIIALQSGAYVVHINLDVKNEDSELACRINGKAGEILPAMLRQTWPDAAL